jgi:hypothetical protein
MEPKKKLFKSSVPERDEKYPHPNEEPPDIEEDRYNSVLPHFPDAKSKYAAELAERLRISSEEGRPDYQIADSFMCLSIQANSDGFKFLAGKLLQMAEAPPGEDLWLPVEPGGMEMGRKLFILRMVGEKPKKPDPPPGPSDEEQLIASREMLAAAAKAALHIPPEQGD